MLTLTQHLMLFFICECLLVTAQVIFIYSVTYSLSAHWACRRCQMLNLTLRDAKVSLTMSGSCERVHCLTPSFVPRVESMTGVGDLGAVPYITPSVIVSYLPILQVASRRVWRWILMYPEHFRISSPNK